MSVAQKSFGTTKNGEEVTLYTITNKNNVSVSVIDYGANLVSLMVPDKNGNVEDIVLGFDNVAGYEVNGCFFGAFIGRHGNRIGDAKFELDGVTYELEKNDGKNNTNHTTNQSENSTIRTKENQYNGYDSKNQSRNRFSI